MVTLSFFGDFVCMEPLRVSPSAAFREWVRADIQVCNFEAPVKSGAFPSPKSGPSLSQSVDSPRKLMDMGFNLILTANNHIMDFGEDGLKTTLKTFGKVKCIGAGEATSVYEPLIIEKDGIRIGLFSLVQHEFGTADDIKENEFGAAWINHPIVSSKVREAKEKCDLLIVLPHAGFENIDVPLPEWRDKYKSLIDLGVDLVIASHPHVPQGWEDYKGKRIYYSLGNFCFDKKIGTNPYWNRSLSVKVSIDDNKQISLEQQNVVFEDGVIDVDNSEEAKHHNDYLQRLLRDEEKYESYLDEQLGLFWESYKLYILRGLGAVSFNSSFNTFIHSAYGVLKGMDVPMLINNFQCETHSWAIQRILRNKMK